MVGKGRVIRPLASRFDADVVVYSESELLLAAELIFRRRRSWGANFSIPAASAALLTISQSTLGVIPWPQIIPALFIALNRHPAWIPLASVQRSSASLAQSGIGTVRM